MGNAKYVLGPMRLPFLIVTPACVVLGAGAAVWETGKMPWLNLILALVGALCTHVSVNALNEYFDLKSGLDLKTRRTPFSGGSGTLPERPEKAPLALATGLVALAIAGLIGIYFAIALGWSILPLGIVGLLLVYTYTVWLTRSSLLCLLAPGLGFGTCMVMGTFWALTGRYTWTSFVASLVPFFLVSNLLLINQFPDVEADKSIGRRHLPIVAGRRTSALVYAAFLILAYLSILVGVILRLLPTMALLGTATLVLAIPTMIGARRYADDIEHLAPYLGINVLITILTPVLLAVGLFLG